jgi:hypothetical protein
MGSHYRPATLHISRSSSPASPVAVSSTTINRSQSPFRYIQHLQQSTGAMNEKSRPQLASASHTASHQKQPSSSPPPSTCEQAPGSSSSSLPPPLPPHPIRQDTHSQLSGLPSPFLHAPTPLLIPSRPQTLSYTRPRGLRIVNCLKPLIPLMLYGATSLAFLLAIALWRAEVFSCEYLLKGG